VLVAKEAKEEEQEEGKELPVPEFERSSAL